MLRHSLRALALAGVVVAAAVAPASGNAATVGAVEGENMTSAVRPGLAVRQDSEASGDAALKIQPNVTVRTTVTLPRPASGFVVRARTDSSGRSATMRVSVDQVRFRATAVTGDDWADVPFGRALAAGSHKLKIRVPGRGSGPLYVDVVTFTSGGGSGDRAAEREDGADRARGGRAGGDHSPRNGVARDREKDRAPRPSPENTATRPAPSEPSPSPSRDRSPEASRPASGTGMRAWVTFYAARDNDPPGSRAIAYPSVHSQATVGKGTYHDPITLAADPDWLPVGTKVWVERFHKYYVMEDLCATCDAGHVDLYLSDSLDPAVEDCEAAGTRDRSLTDLIVVDPDPYRPVDTTPLYTDDGGCVIDQHQY